MRENELKVRINKREYKSLGDLEQLGKRYDQLFSPGSRTAVRENAFT